MAFQNERFNFGICNDVFKMVNLRNQNINFDAIVFAVKIGFYSRGEKS